MNFTSRAPPSYIAINAGLEHCSPGVALCGATHRFAQVPNTVASLPHHFDGRHTNRLLHRSIFFPFALSGKLVQPAEHRASARACCMRPSSSSSAVRFKVFSRVAFAMSSGAILLALACSFARSQFNGGLLRVASNDLQIACLGLAGLATGNDVEGDPLSFAKHLRRLIAPNSSSYAGGGRPVVDSDT